MDSAATHPGFNVIGYATGNLGLGVAARHVIELIRARGYPLAIFDVDPGLDRGKAMVVHPELMVADPALLPHPISIFVLAPPGLATVQKMYGAALVDPQRLNAAFSFWELPVLDGEATAALNAMDVVIGCSDSMRSAYEFAMSGPFVLPGRLPLHMPAGTEARRERFHLPDDAFVFITGFEPYSDPRRKNPLGVVDAFRKAIGDGADALLAIRINNAVGTGASHRVVDELRAAADECPAIRLIEEPLSYVEVLSLYACCDAYVSLHRAEGLGLGPLEAMMLGKPVIATAWSGNMTYMSHTNSCLVPYRLIPVDGTIRSYDQGTLGPMAYWADPDIEQAAAWMKALAGSPALYKKLSARAKGDAHAFNGNALQGTMLDELSTIWSNRQFLPRRSASEPLRHDIQAAFAAKDARIGQLQSQLNWIESRRLYRALGAMKRILQRRPAAPRP